MRSLHVLVVSSLLLLSLLPALPSAAAHSVTTGNSCRYYHTVDDPYPSCAFVCRPGDAVYMQASSQSQVGDSVHAAGECGGVYVVCGGSGGNGCWTTSAGSAGSVAVGRCYAISPRTNGACVAGPPAVAGLVGSATRAAWSGEYSAASFVQYGYDSAKRAAGDPVGEAGRQVAWALGWVGFVTGTVNGVAGPYVALAQDPDGDGATTQAEATSSSDPLSGASRPTTDDDGDGRQNQQEQTRLHAMGVLRSPDVRATAADHAWIHFGEPGATASLTSPSGATLRVTYAPAPTPGGACPGELPAPADRLARDCLVPAVARVSLSGVVESARRADDPAASVPASWFKVACTPSPYAPAASTASCLVGAAVDGTWTLQPAPQAPRASVQAKVPAGMLVSVQGKAYRDVAADSGDIATTGNGQNSRDALMPYRLWNWDRQAPGTTHDACSGGLAAPCMTEAGPVEHPISATWFVGA